MTKILIAEDSPDFAKTYQPVLSKLHFDIMVVSTKEKLTRQLVLNKPDIILLDVLLNGEDGRKICREIKQNSDFKNLPIILASENAEKLTAYQEFLADEYLEKPFQAHTLIDKAEKLLNIKIDGFEEVQ
jgi:DNA-binding response OmpR family regulator